MTSASSPSGHHLYGNPRWAVTGVDRHSILLGRIRLRYFYYEQVQNGSLTEISETQSLFQNFCITPWGGWKQILLESLYLFCYCSLKITSFALKQPMHRGNVLIMWAQVTSFSCSFHLILRLHSSLRLPDTLEKGTTHCLRSTS